jgi:hypothetical protein
MDYPLFTQAPFWENYRATVMPGYNVVKWFSLALCKSGSAAKFRAIVATLPFLIANWRAGQIVKSLFTMRL